MCRGNSKVIAKFNDRCFCYCTAAMLVLLAREISIQNSSSWYKTLFRITGRAITRVFQEGGGGGHSLDYHGVFATCSPRRRRLADKSEANRPRSIYQYSSMAPRLSGQNCKFFKFLLSLNSHRRLGYKENNTKYRR